MNFFNTYRSMFWYGLIFVGLVVMIIVESQFIWNKYQSFSKQESDLNAQISVLQSRNNALSSLSPDVINASKQIALVLPPENSVLQVTSQIRNASIDNKVNVKNLTTSAIPDDTNPGSGTINIGLIAEGDPVDVMTFLQGITQLAPLIQIDTVNLLTNPTSTTAQLTLLSYWSPFPAQLPAITEPIQTLTPDETTLLEELASFKTPRVIDDFEGSNSAIVVNSAPFSPVH